MRTAFVIPALACALLICDPVLHPLLRGMAGVTLVQPNVRPEFESVTVTS